MELKMNTCNRCGAPLNESFNFCRRCGLPVQSRDFLSVYRPCYIPPAAAIKSSTLPYLIWSIILFFFFNIIGTPLAIAGAMYASMANDPECEKPEKKLRKSKILCITATCFDAVTLCFLVAALIIYIMPSLNAL